MKPFRTPTVLPLALAWAIASSTPVPVGATTAHRPAATAAANFAMVSHLAVDGVAEIVAATPDGLTLVYTSADAGVLGLVDITDPTRPRPLPGVNVRFLGVGEPTSVAVSPDGRYAVVALRMDDDRHNARKGFVRVYDLRDPRQVRHVKDISVGVGPDALALVGAGKSLRAIVAIEDEESDSKGDATLGGQRPGHIEVVGLQELYGGRGSGTQVIALTGALQRTPGVLYPQDPQPEFVAISANGRRAVVSLQENNALALLNLDNPRKAVLERVWSAGTVVRQGNADLQKDREIQFTDSFTGRREPDAVAWVAPDIFAMANEGDGKKDAQGRWPGGRGFTLMNTRGDVVYETGDRTERHALQHGHYPDGRSAAKGVEMEGVASARFGGAPFLLVGSERGSFVEVYRLDDPRRPVFVQLLPTGMSPEGLATITGRADGRQLLVTANEGDGSLGIYQFHPRGAPVAVREPQLVAKDASIPWGALSGLTTDGSHLYAVPDNAFAQSRIYRINPADLSQGRMVIDQVVMLTDPAGRPLKVDPEGIAWVRDGFWIAAEGAAVAGNELIKVDGQGVVQQRVAMPEHIQRRFAHPGIATGFEGVAASPDGDTLYVALQRGFHPDRAEAAILKLHLPTGTWTTATYPLDRHSRDARQFWTGLSEIQLTNDGRLLVIERDKGGGESKAREAEIKRVYSVRANDVTEGAVLTKTLVRDLRKDFNYLHEKAEGLVLFRGDVWIVNDNDGAGWTRLLNTGPL